MFVMFGFVSCVAREGLWIAFTLTTRGFATLRTLAMIGVALGGAFMEDWNHSHR